MNQSEPQRLNGANTGSSSSITVATPAVLQQNSPAKTMKVALAQSQQQQLQQQPSGSTSAATMLIKKQRSPRENSNHQAANSKAVGPPTQHRNHNHLQQISMVVHNEEVRQTTTMTDEGNSLGTISGSRSSQQKITEDDHILLDNNKQQLSVVNFNNTGGEVETKVDLALQDIEEIKEEKKDVPPHQDIAQQMQHVDISIRSPPVQQLSQTATVLNGAVMFNNTSIGAPKQAQVRQSQQQLPQDGGSRGRGASRPQKKVIQQQLIASANTNMKQLQGSASAKISGLGVLGRQQQHQLYGTCASASSLIELQAMKNTVTTDYQQRSMAATSQSITGNKALGMATHQNLSTYGPPKRARQSSSQASFGHQQPQTQNQATVKGVIGFKNSSHNYSSTPNMFEGQQIQQNSLNKNLNSQHRKIRKQSTPSQRQQAVKSKSQKKKVTRVASMSMSGGKELNGSSAISPQARNQTYTLVQKAKIPVTGTNIRQPPVKKMQNLFREQVSPEKTRDDNFQDVIRREESQDEEQPAVDENSVDEEIEFIINSKVEDRMISKKSISQTHDAQIRASEGMNQRHHQNELEEEKEVPSEHPNNRKITPTRNGCNVTALKGFSFESMMVLNQKGINNGQEYAEAQTDQDQVQSGRQEVDEEELLQIDPDSRMILTDTEEMGPGQANLRNGVKVGSMPAAQIQNFSKRFGLEQAKIPKEPILVRGVVEKQGESTSFVSQNNSFFNQRFSHILGQQTNQGRTREEPISLDIADLEENKVSMKMTQSLKQTQMMPSTLSVENRPQQPAHSQQTFLIEQSQLMNEQVQSQERNKRIQMIKKDFGRSRVPISALHKVQNGQNVMQQSMASCDLQASFQWNDTRNPRETSSRAKTMMQQKGSAQQPQHQIRPFEEEGSLGQQEQYNETNSEKLFESAEYQAISKARLWREIFYLRELLSNKSQQDANIKNTMLNFQQQLEAEKRRNAAMELQIIELSGQQKQSQQEVQQNSNQEKTTTIPQRSKPQHPILQNELRSRSLVPFFPKADQHSDSASLESSNMAHSSAQLQMNQFAITEEHDVGAKQAPNHSIQRATQDNFQRSSVALGQPQLYQQELDHHQVALIVEQNTMTLQDAAIINNSKHIQRANEEESKIVSPQFNPPTKASQLRIQQPSTPTLPTYMESNYLQDDEEDARDSAHALPPQGLNTVHATARAQSSGFLLHPLLQDQSHQQLLPVETARRRERAPPSMMDSSSASLLNRVDEENNHFTSSESVLINKVNEMQTKTASFGYQQQPSQEHSRRFLIYRQQNPSQQIQQEQIRRNASASQESLRFEARNGLTIAEQDQFLEYEIDEQVASGVRIMSGPRGGPQISQMVQGGQPVSNTQAQQVASAQYHVQLTTLSQHNQIELPPTLHTQVLRAPSIQTQPSIYQNTQLHQQRPCDQPPPRNIQGDIQSHVDAEEISNLEGVGSGLVTQQRVPLPNQQQQPMPRQPSHDSLLDPDLPPYHFYPATASRQYAPSGQQHSLRSAGFRPQHVSIQPSVADDAGMDEFDVADERLHLFGDQVNPDIMTYEQLLALQERIGFVTKGMTVQEMDKYPTMKRSQVRRYLVNSTQGKQRNIETTVLAPVNFDEGQDMQPDNNENTHQQEILLQPPQIIEFHSQPQQQNNQTFYRSMTESQINRAIPTFEAEEEEKNSQQESLGEKSLPLPGSSEGSSGPIHGTQSHNMSSKQSNRASNIQHALVVEENYQSMQNSRTAATMINQAHLSRQTNQVRQLNFKAPVLEHLQEDQSEQHPHVLNLQQNNAMSFGSNLEEGKEDLEEAAPEEHHPKEEHLQQIGVSVPMPGHHLASHGRGSSSFTLSSQQMHQFQNQGMMVMQNQRQQQQQQQQRHQLASFLQMQRAQNNILTDEEDINCSLDPSQEDVFDEGEDVLNRRLPIVVNINGSIPNQRPSRIQASTAENLQNCNENNVQDFERQHPLYAGAIAIQSNLARQSRAIIKEQQQPSVIDDELANMSHVYEELKQNEFGVQMPKYAQTKTSQKHQQQQQDGSNSMRTMGENHHEDEASTLRQIDQPTIVKHHGQSNRQHQTKQQHQHFLVNSDPTMLALQQKRQSAQSIAAQSSCSKQSSSGVSTTLGQEICIVCQEVFQADDSVKVLPPCQHYFHVNCVNQWLLVEKKCPMCMSPLDGGGQ